MLLIGRDGSQELFPPVGEQPAGAILVKPVDLFIPAEEYPPQYQPGHPVGVLLRVGQAQCAAPGTAKNQPALNPGGFPDSLHVTHQQLSGIFAGLGVRSAFTGAPLIYQYYPVELRIEIPAINLLNTTPRTAMDEQHRPASGVTALFVVNGVQIGDG